MNSYSVLNLIKYSGSIPISPNFYMIPLFISHMFVQIFPNFQFHCPQLTKKRGKIKQKERDSGKIEKKETKHCCQIRSCPPRSEFFFSDLGGNLWGRRVFFSKLFNFIYYLYIKIETIQSCSLGGKGKKGKERERESEVT